MLLYVVDDWDLLDVQFAAQIFYGNVKRRGGRQDDVGIFFLKYYLILALQAQRQIYEIEQNEKNRN